MRCSYLICFCIIGGFCYGQPKVDSLRNQLHLSLQTKNFKDAASSLLLIGNEFLTDYQYDSALACFRRSLFYTDRNDKAMIATSFNGMGVIYSKKGAIDSSIYYYKGALRLFKELGSVDYIATIEANLSIIYKDKGLYDDALEYAFSALPKLEGKAPDRPLASCYSTIGIIYTSIKEFDKAIQFHRKALNVRLLIKYSKGVGQSYNNIGEAFLKAEQYDSALHYFTLAKDIKLKNGEKAPITLNNIGEVLMKTNQWEAARNYFEQALAIHQEMKDQLGQVKSLLHLGRVSLHDVDFAKTDKYLNEAEKLARQSGSWEYLRQVLELRITCYERQHDFKKAFLFTKELLVVKDTLLNAEKAEAISTLQIKYETDQKEQQIALLQTERDLQAAQLQARAWWVKSLVIAASLLIIIIVLVFVLYKTSQKNKRKVELLLKELNHRVKNNLQMLSNLLMLQSDHLKDETALQAVKSSEGRVNAMALIHKKLSVYDQLQQINMKEYLEELTQYLTHSYGYSTPHFSLELSLEDIRLSVDRAIPIGLIVNELVSNACKYAFANQPNPGLKVSLQSDSSGKCIIKVADNGIGMKEKITPSDSFGLKMVNMLARELRAQIEQVNNKGASFMITIPPAHL